MRRMPEMMGSLIARAVFSAQFISIIVAGDVSPEALAASSALVDDRFAMPSFSASSVVSVSGFGPS